ncbi:MAG: hypothetical protein FJW40_03695 [Acidobacteria bacterium]|nr:hypothetical protein [Acidobacteriota bacterium]
MSPNLAEVTLGNAAEQQLERILAHPRFSGSARLSEFLRFVARASLDGDLGSTKEVVIAAEVYGRGTGYDPQVDSTVRSEASRLRARLREYYVGDGQFDPVVVEIARGGYAPVFRYRNPAPPSPVTGAGRPGAEDGPSDGGSSGDWLHGARTGDLGFADRRVAPV